jgi:hypothetical protein
LKLGPAEYNLLYDTNAYYGDSYALTRAYIL